MARNLTLPETDRALLIAECKRVGAKSALEFGPGYSTEALIEAGVENIVSCEHDHEWLAKAKEQFPQVRIIEYRDEPEADAPELFGVFDIAFVDSPKGNKAQRKRHPGQEDCSRLNTCLLALKHSPVVLLHDAYRPLERGTLGRLNAMGHRFTMLDCDYGMARINRNENA